MESASLRGVLSFLVAFETSEISTPHPHRRRTYRLGTYLATDSVSDSTPSPAQRLGLGDYIRKDANRPVPIGLDHCFTRVRFIRQRDVELA